VRLSDVYAILADKTAARIAAAAVPMGTGALPAEEQPANPAGVMPADLRAKLDTALSETDMPVLWEHWRTSARDAVGLRLGHDTTGGPALATYLTELRAWRIRKGWADHRELPRVVPEDGPDQDTWIQ
jgi:hypothetical protein